MNNIAVKRILVALDASPDSHAALEEAATIAAGLEAELAGLFVLDTELLRLAALPSARETGLMSASRRALDPVRMERALIAQAERARLNFESIARQHQVRCSFRMSRGNVAGELVEAAVGADMIAMGLMGHMSLAGSRLGSTTRQVWARSECSLLLARGRATDGKVLVVCADTPETTDLLDLALSLAARRGAELLVLLPGDEATRTRLRSRIDDQPSKPPVQVSWLDESEVGVDTLARLIRQERVGLVVVSQEGPWTSDRDALIALGSPVLLVRLAQSARAV